MDMLTDLYDNLEDDPRNIMTRELILDAWIQLGNQDMAIGIANEIQQLDPSNASARTFLNRQRVPSSSRQAQPEPPRQPLPISVKGKKTTIKLAPMPRTEQERAAMEQSFKTGYADLRSQTEPLLGEMRALQTVGRLGDDTLLEDLQHLLDGRLATVVSRTPPCPIRELARALSSTRGPAALELIIADFEEVLDWTLSTDPSASSDAIRKRLVARQTLLEAAVPQSTAGTVKQALTHVEHERLRRLAGGRRYANTETMLGDDVASIPRANLLVTEDNYAWDMSELADALVANSGVMRNPLTRDMFSPDDVRAILRHPLGAKLAPLRLEQNQLKKGVRPDTIARLAKIASTMLSDQTPDAGPSMAAVDEFLTYVAGLPAAEQKTLDELKIPATDSHTGLAFDYTVGESVRDAKANRTCFHKTGDFLGQAARYLGRS
ncbi:hypothetical protein CONLIGDRAFT_440798 [Coniochaeta ligniaria NRRL 30616]|uniref:Uncharacterized protein n=1 Tax=Coniochaeta ligniaria NRRL 30616 TaxID=1408157 RepID=A0A1J7JEB9_9PEZI|nr:hypothetical protein CONLIGDRAFT_440798 [Coniochaeta ligniaria NRRL 30616]